MRFRCPPQGGASTRCPCSVRLSVDFSAPPLPLVPVDLEALRNHCLAQPEVSEEQPFGPDVLVWKVGGKMFAMCNLERMPTTVALKTDPERTVELRDRYDGIDTGPYVKGLGWNHVTLRSDVPDALVRELVDHSWDEVVKGLKKAERERLTRTG